MRRLVMRPRLLLYRIMHRFPRSAIDDEAVTNLIVLPRAEVALGYVHFLCLVWLRLLLMWPR